MGRIEREKDCIEKMLRIYCHDIHGTKSGLCNECRELLDYANLRIDKCPFGAKKSTCGKCTIHCYKKDMRARIKEVMRHSGPKMTYKHPVLAALHFLDGFKKAERKIPGSNE